MALREGVRRPEVGRQDLDSSASILLHRALLQRKPLPRPIDFDRYRDLLSPLNRGLGLAIAVVLERT